MNLDTTNWRYFTIGGQNGIFDLKKGYYNKKPEHTTVGTIPFIGATENNNGVTEYYSIDDIERTHKDGSDAPDNIDKKIFRGNCITVTNNGSVGHAYYQKGEFTCSHDVNPLYLRGRELNEYIALFLCAVIEQDRYRWAYGRKWRPERMERSIIKLPVDSSGQPNFDYMENYIKALHCKKITTKICAAKYPLMFQRWKEYRLDELFYIKKGKRLTKADMVDGSTNYLGAISDNNGVRQQIEVEREQQYTPNCITVNYNGSVGEAFYQSEPFWASDDVNVLYAKDWTLNKYTALFITTVIKANRYRFSYGRKWTLEKMSETIIKLPAKEDGAPDFPYMEHYIKSLPYSDKI